MSIRSWPATFLALGFAAVPAIAAQLPERAMDALLAKHFAPDRPGAVVLVQKGGKVLLHKAYGLASLEPRQPLAVDQQFRVASVTKTFTAAAVLRLAEEGKLDLDSSIRSYLPGLPEAWEPVTVADLLGHTGGLPNYTDDPAWWPRQGEDLQPAALLATFVQPKPLDFAPGSRWSYSNSGYLLLGLLIEAAAGKPFGEALRSRFLEPLGMSATQVGAGGPGLARGHLGDLRPAPTVSQSQLFSTAGLVSTAADLGRWLRALTTGTAVSAASFRKMCQSRRLADGSDAGYGFGLYLRPSQGHRLAGHGGQVLGYTAFVEADLDGDAQAVILTNRFPAAVPLEYLSRRLLALAIGRPIAEPRIVQLPAAKLARLAGRYEGGRRPVRVVFHEGRLWVRKGPERVELLPISETAFLEKDSDTRFAFALGEAKAAGLRVQVPGAPEARYLARTGDEEEPAVVALGAAQLDACAGIYEPAPGVRVRYRRDGTRFFCDDPDEGPIELEAVAPDRFRVKGGAIRVEFQRDPEGRIVEVVTRFDERSVRARRLE